MKKFITTLIIFSLLLTSLVPCSFADNVESQYYEPIVVPRYEVLYSISASLNISDSGRADCTASVRVPSGYKVELLAELQQKDGSRWETIHDWEASGSTRISVYGPWYVLPGYSYRLKVTATTYDSSGNFIEAPVEYSPIRDY